MRKWSMVVSKPESLHLPVGFCHMIMLVHEAFLLIVFLTINREIIGDYLDCSL